MGTNSIRHASTTAPGQACAPFQAGTTVAK
ncbi:hypothetical protein B0G62_110104 [Paraburkholderia eburnea]|uniref:Uncharacterized protein n=1 Tax=Paraburkholderia eburnea TaxID=1189126 RepID=A0A2S4M4Z1_9BURK|nr:hypothetical protein B0G62_110104 [Paraburkholderia eburnea]PRZ20224.1 hypothetical protein BX588_112104 [Paraburkholderia eburnea]